MPVINTPTALAAELFRHAAEQNIDRGPMTVDLFFIGQDHHVSQRHLLHFQVAIAGADQRAASLQNVSGLRLFHPDRADFIQSPREHFREVFRHVLYHENSAGKIRRQLRQ